MKACCLSGAGRGVVNDVFGFGWVFTFYFRLFCLISHWFWLKFLEWANKGALYLCIPWNSYAQMNAIKANGTVINNSPHLNQVTYSPNLVWVPFPVGGRGSSPAGHFFWQMRACVMMHLLMYPNEPCIDFSTWRRICGVSSWPILAIYSRKNTSRGDYKACNQFFVT